MLPLSGPLASFGKKALRAMSMALGVAIQAVPKKISEAEALGIKIVVADSEGNPSVATQLAKSLIDNYNISLMIGDLSNEVSLSIALICQQQKVPLLSLSRQLAIEKPNSYVFSFNPSPTQQLSFLVDYAMNTQKYKKFGILFPRHNYGISMAKAFYEAVKKRGGSITSLQDYDAHETTFTQAVKNLVGLYCVAHPCDAKKLLPQVNFEALFIPEFNKLAYVIPALVQADILVTNNANALKAYALTTKIKDPHAVQLLGLNSWNEPSTLQKLGNQANGAFFVDAISFETEPVLKNFKQTFEEQGLGTPTLMEVLAHDAMALAMKILAQKPKSRKVIQKAIAEFSDRAALLKHISFNQDHELLTDSVGFSVLNGSAHAN